MMKNTLFSVVLILLAAMFSAFVSPFEGKLTSQKTHISFFSHTPVEDITANNYKSVSTIDTQTGEVVFSVPMQSFEFEKALMQKHFNNKDFLDTKAHPKAKLTGRILNLASIDFSKDGEYPAEIEGEMTIKGVAKPIKETGKINVKDGIVIVESKFNITLADYGITFAKGKPSTNIAKTVEVTVLAEYKAD